MAAIDMFWIVMMPLVFVGLVTAAFGFNAALQLMAGIGLVILLIR
jgi:hypothetical protein